MPTLGFWPLAVALVPLFVLVAKREHAGGAFGLGFWFGVGFFSLHIFWLPQSFAELFGPAAWIIYPPLVLIVSSFWGLVCYVSRLCGRRGVVSLLLLPALWILMEWARTQGVFAFPWGTLGYIWLDTPLAPLAQISGVYGLGLFTTVLASLFALPFVYRETSLETLAKLLGVSAVLVAAVLTYSLLNRAEIPAAEHQALLVQGNTDPLGRVSGLENEIERYIRLTKEAREAGSTPDLVIWPEGVVVVTQNLASFQNKALRKAIQASAPAADFVVGGTAWVAGRNYNSVYSMSDAQVIDRFDKVYLVPFGEYYPLVETFPSLYRTVFNWFGLGLLSSRTPGDAVAPLRTPLALTATYICYESVFPQVARTMVAKGAGVLINISNDAWFGRGRGAEQHFDMGRMRAIETGRYLLRVGNDGITALVNPRGEVIERLPRGIEGTLTVNFGLSDVITPYVRYGDWLIGALAIYAVLLTLGRVWQRRRARASQ